MTVNVKDVAEYFRAYATHHVHPDWAYTRDTQDLEHIRYTNDYVGYNSRWNRFKRWSRDYLGKMQTWEKNLGMRWFSVKHPIIHAQTYLLKDKNMPDGVLNEGKVLVVWEEDGEYIQLVQPSVGVLLADFLDSEPDNPHAVKIASEIERIQDDYEKRAKSWPTQAMKRNRRQKKAAAKASYNRRVAARQMGREAAKKIV